MKKVSRKIARDQSLPFEAMLIHLLLMFGGLAPFFLGRAGSLGRMTYTFAIVGMALTVCGLAAYGVHKRLLLGRIRKEAPWKLLGKPLGAVRLEGERVVQLVPVGDSYYSDYNDFSTVNGHLVKEIRQKISTEVIDTGAWKALGEKVKAE